MPYRVSDHVGVDSAIQAYLIKPDCLMTKLPEKRHGARDSHVGQEFHVCELGRRMVFSLANQAAYSMACRISGASSSG
jgi:hypothetical protein